MRKINYSPDEQRLLEDFVRAHDGKTIAVSELKDLADTLNLTFHGGSEVRSFSAVNTRIYKLREKMAKGPEESVHKEPKKATKTMPATALCHLVLCAKTIKKQADEFCKAVTEFSEEFERNRALLKKLAKLREAARELQPDEL